jgi:hypothetical protein
VVIDDARPRRSRPAIGGAVRRRAAVIGVVAFVLVDIVLVVVAVRATYAPPSPPSDVTVTVTRTVVAP